MSVCTTVVSTRSCRPSSSSRSTAAATTNSLIALSVAGVSRVKPRHPPGMEVRELAQRIAVGDPLPQFAIVPVLDAHQHQRTQHLLRRQATATGRGVLQASYQIASDPFDHVLLVVEKIGNSLQHRLKTQTLPHQLPIGKIDLSLYRPRHDSTLVARRSRALSLQCLDVARCRLVQQILQSPSVVQTALHLRNKLLRNVNRNATPLGAIVQDIALMLFARQTSRAVHANTPTATQAQRAKKRRP